MKGVYLLVVCALFVACNAHRHHLDHHGRNHEGDTRAAHHRHHPEQDLKVVLADLSTPENETITIDVTKRIAGAGNGKIMLKVNLRIHAVRGIVHINGHKVDHSLVTSIHVRTIIGESSPNGMLFKRPAVVQVRVLVTESTNANGLRMLAVQEEIIEVSNDQVEQIDVKEIILEFSNNVQEKKRSVSIIKLTKSKIHRLERKHDKHLWACKGRVPKDPFSVSREEMRRWKHMHRRPPTFELGHNRGGMFNDDDNDDDNDDKKHHHVYHHHHNRWGRKFCRWFHKLPVATRAAFGLSVILFGILMVVACWTCCCKKPRAKPEVKYELGDTASVDLQMEEEYLTEKKKPLDEQPLVA